MTINYHKIEWYNKHIDNYLLGYWFAKRLSNIFWELHDNYIDDLLQEIAYCCIAEPDKYKLRIIIDKQLRKLHKGTRKLIRPIIVENRKKVKFDNKPKEKQKCDLCEKEKQEYMRKNVLANKQICSACYMKIKRENKRRNSDNSTWRNATVKERLQRNLKIFMLCDQQYNYAEIEQLYNLGQGYVSHLIYRYKNKNIIS